MVLGVVDECGDRKLMLRRARFDRGQIDLLIGRLALDDRRRFGFLGQAEQLKQKLNQ